MPMTGSAAAWSADLRDRIEAALEAVFAARPPPDVVRAARYVTLGGGHRWRGLLAVAAGAIFRADARTCVLPLAAALGVEGGEEVSWELLDRDELHLVRLAARPAEAKRTAKRPATARDAVGKVK